MLRYTNELGKLIYDMKCQSPANEPIAKKIEGYFGERPSSFRVIREWYSRYLLENNLDDGNRVYNPDTGRVVRRDTLSEIDFPYSPEFEIEPENDYPDIQRQFESYVAEEYRRKKDVTIGVLSDVHLPDENENAVKLAYKILNIAQPDILIYNGDLLNLSTESRYPNTHRAMAEDSLSLALRKLDRYESLLKYTPVWKLLLTGNHDIRYRDYLQSMSASIRNAAIRDFNHQLSKRDIIFGGWDTAQVYYKRQLLIQHGDSTGINTARNNLLKSGYGFLLSVFGHAHKHQDSVQTSLAGEFASIVSGGLQSKSPDYKKDKSPANWQYGIVLLTMDGEDVMPTWDNIKFSEKGNTIRALFGGQIVEAG